MIPAEALLDAFVNANILFCVAYLCWLGATLILRRRTTSVDDEKPSSSRRLRLSPFAEGVVCDLSNPKTLLVFTSVIPQFLPSDGGSPLQAAVLGATFATIGLATLVAYSMLFGRIGLAGLQSRLGDLLLRLSGAVLVFFGVRLAVEPAD